MEIQNFSGVNSEIDLLDPNSAKSILNYLKQLDFDKMEEDLTSIILDLYTHLELENNPHKDKLTITYNDFITSLYHSYLVLLSDTTSVTEVNMLSLEEFTKIGKSNIGLLTLLCNFTIARSKVSNIDGGTLDNTQIDNVLSSIPSKHKLTINSPEPCYLLTPTIRDVLFQPYYLYNHNDCGIIYSDSSSLNKERTQILSRDFIPIDNLNICSGIIDIRVNNLTSELNTGIVIGLSYFRTNFLLSKDPFQNKIITSLNNDETHVGFNGTALFDRLEFIIKKSIINGVESTGIGVRRSRSLSISNRLIESQWGYTHITNSGECIVDGYETTLPNHNDIVDTSIMYVPSSSFTSTIGFSVYNNYLYITILNKNYTTSNYRFNYYPTVSPSIGKSLSKGIALYASGLNYSDRILTIDNDDRTSETQYYINNLRLFNSSLTEYQLQQLTTCGL